ncbi:MAG: hypothetical protein V1743_04080 [Nanoarchaeota archaeon]
MKRAIGKTICVLAALFQLAGCGDSKPISLFRDTTMSPEQRIIQYDNFLNNAYTRVTVFGDIPPYGSLDYVVVAEKDSTGVHWERGKVITHEDPAFADCQQEYFAKRKELW